MITSKQELNEFLERDRLALHQTRSHPRSFGDDVWKYQIRLRKTEWYWYSGKCLRNPFNAVRFLISKRLLSKRALKLVFLFQLMFLIKGCRLLITERLSSTLIRRSVKTVEFRSV